jgi:hypothetical protein
VPGDLRRLREGAVSPRQAAAGPAEGGPSAGAP